MSVRLNKKREFSDLSDSSMEKTRLKKRKNLSSDIFDEEG